MMLGKCKECDSMNETQRKIMAFLYSHINKKFSVSKIHKELSNLEEISYQLVQTNILYLQWNKKLEVEWKHPYKLVWINKIQ